MPPLSKLTISNSTHFSSRWMGQECCHWQSKVRWNECRRDSRGDPASRAENPCWSRKPWEQRGRHPLKLHRRTEENRTERSRIESKWREYCCICHAKLLHNDHPTPPTSNSPHSQRRDTSLHYPHYSHRLSSHRQARCGIRIARTRQRRSSKISIEERTSPSSSSPTGEVSRVSSGQLYYAPLFCAMLSSALRYSALPNFSLLCYILPYPALVCSPA